MALTNKGLAIDDFVLYHFVNMLSQEASRRDARKKVHT